MTASLHFFMLFIADSGLNQDISSVHINICFCLVCTERLTGIDLFNI